MKDVSVGGTMSEKENRERGNLIIIWLILDTVFLFEYICVEINSKYIEFRLISTIG